VAEKQHAEKEGKAACKKRKKEEKQCGAHADKPSHVRVRVLDMNVMAISQ
jgi:hypothetical protein